MRIFVTGATGYIGSAVVHELISAGHEVLGLTRSDAGIAKLEAAGAAAHRGDIDDLESLKKGAAASEGVIHLAFKHDFAHFDTSLASDLRAIEAMGSALEGSGKPFVTTVHMNGEASDNATLAMAKRGVRASVASLAPSVHGKGDKGFVPTLIRIAREKGMSAYVGDGTNRWPAVHRLDAARLFRLAVEKAPAGSRLSGVADEGVPFIEIAQVIARHLEVPLKSITPEEAMAHFGFLGPIAQADLPRSSTETQALLGWEPRQPSLIEDLEQGHYFET